MRLIFNRKHKTLRAVLSTKVMITHLLSNSYTSYMPILTDSCLDLLPLKPTIKMLQENYKTVMALKNLHRNENGAMDIVDEKDIDIKEVLEEVLADERFKDHRAAQMDLNDIFELLESFHRRGLHFGS